MKYIILTILIITSSFANIDNMNSFEADFTQTITDDKNKVLTYSGHIVAMKPQYAKWSYTKPVKKDVFIGNYKVIIVEPEIEQVILKRLESTFDFFKIIDKAKKVNDKKYTANYRNSIYTIIKNSNTIESISYIDEFENKVKVHFSNQKQDHKIDFKVFEAKYPAYFDVIRD